MKDLLIDRLIKELNRSIFYRENKNQDYLYHQGIAIGIAISLEALKHITMEQFDYLNTRISHTREIDLEHLNNIEVK